MNSTNLDDVRAVVEKLWGYRELRPLQQEAMSAVLDDRDSLVVLPTGGGKSLCYQAPAVARGGTTVVVSPLISLMKDQVDSLRECGVPAVQIDSSLSPSERFSYEMDIHDGAIRLVFVSPERLAVPEFGNLLRKIGVSTFAIDEAHCISHWGHDFRPDYRQMGRIKEMFPGARIHAYTATATEQVRRDICNQLRMENPLVLVGNFDRPNLTYRILPRLDLESQVMAILKKHKGEPGIIYCLRRRDVDDVNTMLQGLGVQSLPYHAGLTPDERRTAQEAFATEKCDLIVATIAFGMGIDRSNIRFVLHIAMPKSIEHYQQETGRAGRDGLEAECTMLYSGQDVMTWKWIMEKSAQQAGGPKDFLAGAFKHLDDLDNYCKGSTCRHRALVQYFGQRYEDDNCAACDLCLGDAEPVPDAQVVAQKILSCVYRVGERFGAGHVVSVLRGENTERVRSLKHDQLTTYGLLREHGKAEIRDWIHQLIGQQVLLQDGVEFPVLKLNEASFEVMKKTRTIKLMRPVRTETESKPRQSRADTVSWEGVDRELFEELRTKRRELSEARAVPAYIILTDAALRELAKIRPSTLERMRYVSGIGDTKLKEIGQVLLDIIVPYCREHAVALDVKPPVVIKNETPRPVGDVKANKALAYSLFRQQCAIDDVMHQTGRARATVTDYLCDFIRLEKPQDLSPWIADDVRQQVEEVARRVGTDKLKPIFLELGEKVPYDVIRLAVACME